MDGHIVHGVCPLLSADFLYNNRKCYGECCSLNPIIYHSPLFSGLSGAETTKALSFFDAFQKHYGKGAFLHRLLSPLDHFGLVLSGTVQVYMDDMDGYRMIMANVEPGGIFGESLCFLGKGEEICIVATTDCEILWMDTVQLKASGGRDSFEMEMANRFISMVCHRALTMNNRLQILSKNTLRGKLCALFSQYASRYGDEFTLPFDRESMASYLGVNRSALSRELSAMAQDGLISYHKNRFRLHRNLEG